MTALVVLAVLYVLAAYPLYRIAKATHDCGEMAWFACVPILSLVLMCRIAGVSAWTILVLLLAFVPLVGWLVSLVYSLILWVKIGQLVRPHRLGSGGRDRARDRRVGVRVRDQAGAGRVRDSPAGEFPSGTA